MSLQQVFDQLGVQGVTHPNAHGEVRFFKVTKGTVNLDGFTPFNDKKTNGDLIVGHSESGHHHVLEREPNMTVYEKTVEGRRLIHAVLTQPRTLYQDALGPHESQTVEPGEYIITSDSEYDPFLQQARRVAD